MEDSISGPSDDSYPPCLAEEYDCRAFLWQLYLPVIRRLIPSGSVVNALDLGCGTGSLLLALRDEVRSGLGVDRSPSMIDVARRKQIEGRTNNLAFRIADIRTLSLGGSYELILSTDGVLPSLRDAEELGMVLAGISAFLAPGGRAIVELWTPAANPEPENCDHRIPPELLTIRPENLAIPADLFTLPTGSIADPQELATILTELEELHFCCESDHSADRTLRRYRFYLPTRPYSYTFIESEGFLTVHRHRYFRPDEIRKLITRAGLFVESELGLKTEREASLLCPYYEGSTIWSAVVGRAPDRGNRPFSRREAEPGGKLSIDSRTRSPDSSERRSGGLQQDDR